MHSNADSVEDYLESLPPDRREPISTIRDVINANLPEGYVEQMERGMVTWVIPLEDYPDTYHKKPLSYISLASQKNHMAVYLMGLHSEGPEESWFRQQYAERAMKLDMGKSCVRFKKLEEVPLDVLGEVVAKIPASEFIARYEEARRR